VNKSSLRRARIILDDNALQHNLQRVKAYAPKSRCMAVIKANAYGHGLLTVARILSHVLSSSDYLAVAMPAEAFELRRAGIKQAIVVLHGVNHVDELRECFDQGIGIVVNQMWQLDLLEQWSQNLSESSEKALLKIWLKVDTGMHRLGVAVDDVTLALSRMAVIKEVQVEALMSHFSSADEIDKSINNSQLFNLVKLNSTLKKPLSMANSAAIISLPDSHLDVVRPGIMLYGSSPFSDKTAEQLGLKPVMNFESELIAIYSLKKGDAIGYGATWVCLEDMQVGVVAVGYGDGYPRHAKSATPVWLNEKRCGLLGRVSMDSICIDLRGVEASVGDRVVLWGKELAVDEIALCAETISYELLCHAGGISG